MVPLQCRRREAERCIGQDAAGSAASASGAASRAGGRNPRTGDQVDVPSLLVITVVAARGAPSQVLVNARDQPDPRVGLRGGGHDWIIARGADTIWGGVGNDSISVQGEAVVLGARTGRR